MDIVALSMNLNQMKVAQQASISVMKLAMDSAEGQSKDLINLMSASAKNLEQSINPQLGANIDVKG
jgi:hypothetical protein